MSEKIETEYKPTVLEKAKNSINYHKERVNNHLIHNLNAYAKAAEKHLKNEKGDFDVKLLDSAEIAKQFVQAKIDYHQEALSKRIGFNIDLNHDDPEHALYSRRLLEEHIGFDPEKYTELVIQQGSNWTADAHTNQHQRILQDKFRENVDMYVNKLTEDNQSLEEVLQKTNLAGRNEKGELGFAPDLANYNIQKILTNDRAKRTIFSNYLQGAGREAILESLNKYKLPEQKE